MGATGRFPRLRAALSTFSRVNNAVQADRPTVQDPRLADLANLTPGQRRGRRAQMDRPASLPFVESTALSPTGENAPLEQIQLSDAIQAPAQEEKKRGFLGLKGAARDFREAFKTDEGRSKIFGLAGAIASAGGGEKNRQIAAFAESQRAEIRQKEVDVANQAARDAQIGQRKRELDRLDEKLQLEKDEAEAKLPPIRVDQNTGQNVFLSKAPDGTVIQTPVTGSLAKKLEKVTPLERATLTQKSGDLVLQKANVRLTELLRIAEKEKDPFRKAQLELGISLIGGLDRVSEGRRLAATSQVLSSIMGLFTPEDRLVLNEFRNENIESSVDNDADALAEQRTRNLVYKTASGGLRLDVIDTPDAPTTPKKKSTPASTDEPEKPTIRATATVNGIRILPKRP